MAVVREALMRADEGSERLRDGEGEEEVRPGSCLSRWCWSHCWVLCC